MYLKTIATVAKRGLNTTILTCSQFGLTEASDLYYFTHGKFLGLHTAHSCPKQVYMNPPSFLQLKE